VYNITCYSLAPNYTTECNTLAPNVHLYVVLLYTYIYIYIYIYTYIHVCYKCWFQDNVDFTNDAVNNKTQPVISNLSLCLKLMKAGYTDYALDVMKLTLPMTKGLSIGVCPLTPKGLNTERLRVLTEAAVGQLLSPIPPSKLDDESDDEICDAWHSGGTPAATEAATGASTGDGGEDKICFLDDLTNFLDHNNSVMPDSTNREAYKFIALQVTPAIQTL
jgi:hypothetical protein